MPILETLRGRASGVQHAGSSRVTKADVQPVAWRVFKNQRSHRISLSARKRKATCHDSTHATPANRSLAATAFPEARSKEGNGLQIPRSPQPSQIKDPQPTGLTLDQGNGGRSGHGSGGNGGGGDGGEDGNSSSGDSEPRVPLFFGFISLIFRGPVLAILLSIVIYNWLQARHRRKQAPDAAAGDAEEQAAAAPGATLFLGDDWPPLYPGEQQDASAPHGFAAGHTAARTERAGPLSRLTRALHLTRNGQRLREGIHRLKRLQRDAFEQMLRLDTRLETLEERSANSLDESSSGVSALFSSTQGSVRAKRVAERAPIQASGQAVYSTAVLIHGGQGDSSRQQQHLSAGPEVRLRLDSSDADTGRSVKALVAAGTSQNEPLLQKLLYGGPAGENFRILVALLNGRGDDLAPTLHPRSGRGVTHLMRHGCPLHQACQGSGVGAKYRAGGYDITAAHLRGGSEGSTLLQVDCAPTSQLALGITGMQHGARSAAHGAQTVTAVGRDPADEEAGAMLAPSGSVAEHSQGSSSGSGHSLALTGAWRSYYDEYAISGWLALDRASRNQQQSWGATISSIPDMDGQGWALSLGRVPFSASAVDQEQLVAEAALHIRAGKGLLLTPSVICSHSEQGPNALAALRTELSF